MIYTGQCKGAIVQGLGLGLTEKTQIGNGLIRTNNFTTYIIPTICDVPEIQVKPVEDAEKIGPFGAKGLGEIGIVPVGSAVANAIYDAIGTRLFTLPATPERIFRRSKESRTMMAARVKVRLFHELRSTLRQSEIDLRSKHTGPIAGSNP